MRRKKKDNLASEGVLFRERDFDGKEPQLPICSMSALVPLCLFRGLAYATIRWKKSDCLEETGGRGLRYLFVSLAILVLDQWTKWLVLKNMHFAESIPVIDGFFYITSHRNRGAAFGILQNQQWLFIIITLFVIGFILYYLWKGKEEHLLMPVALSLVLGGAVGNLIDRVRFQEVVDFIHFQFGSYTFPLFNIADSAIVIGVILLMIFILKTPPSDEKNVTEARDS